MTLWLWQWHYSKTCKLFNHNESAWKKIEALEKDILKTSKINERKELFKELQFCNVSIDKLKIKKFTNVEMLSELPFYDELNIVPTVTAFKKYVRSYRIEIIKDKDGNMNDPSVQWEARKPVIKDLFRDLLTELKGF